MVLEPHQPAFGMGHQIDRQPGVFLHGVRADDRDMYGHERKAIEAATDAELLVESYHLTEAIYAYQQTWDGNTYHYIYRWHQDCERQLYIAGIRLAQLLNSIYK